MWCWGVIGRVVHGVSVNLVSLSHHILPHYTVLTTTSLVSNVLVHVKNISVSWVGLALDAQPSQRESMQQEICGWYCRPGTPPCVCVANTKVNFAHHKIQYI